MASQQLQYFIGQTATLNCDVRNASFPVEITWRKIVGAYEIVVAVLSQAIGFFAGQILDPSWEERLQFWNSKIILTNLTVQDEGHYFCIVQSNSTSEVFGRHDFDIKISSLINQSGVVQSVTSPLVFAAMILIAVCVLAVVIAAVYKRFSARGVIDTRGSTGRVIESSGEPSDSNSSRASYYSALDIVNADDVQPINRREEETCSIGNVLTTRL